MFAGDWLGNAAFGIQWGEDEKMSEWSYIAGEMTIEAAGKTAQRVI